MIDTPLTLEQAQKYRYNQWGGNPNGTRYDPSRCAMEVMNNWLFRQCSRNNGFGPQGLYCKQHAKLWLGYKETP
jgi:hypothetical protein